MLLTWLSLTACDPLGTIPPERPEEDTTTQSGLFIQPTVLDFGDVRVTGERESLAFTVTNVGDEDRTVYNHTNVLSEDLLQVLFEVDAEPLFSLKPGESTTIPVTFSPVTFGEQYAELHINNEPELFVQLSGHGNAPVISLSVEEPQAVPVGCSEVVPIVISNTGDEPLLLQEIQLSNSDDYTLLSAPAAVDPGDDGAIEVLFDPSYPLDIELDPQRELELVVASNDPFTSHERIIFDIVAQESFAESELVYYPGLEVDLLIAVDNTGVTNAHLQKAEEDFSVLLNTMVSANVDLNTAIITGGQSCPYTTPTFTTAQDSVGVVESMLLDGLGGSSGSGSDQLLVLASDALARADSGCLSGFLREGALLHVMVISGRADSSPASIDAQLDALWAEVPSALDVMVSAIVATEEDGCLGADYGEGYTDAAVSTSGEIGDLCSDSWASSFESIAMRSGARAEGALSAILDHTPVPETISVKVDGLTWESWTWSESMGAVVFPKDSAPDTGSRIEINYLQAQECAQ
ncbi:MAG: choice-of-anchor D domain-containing protein [Myxococcota bacterium]|nr:choice-of-anchor D domain-containing protein [Myxococcota bacterium]